MAAISDLIHSYLLKQHYIHCHITTQKREREVSTKSVWNWCKLCPGFMCGCVLYVCSLICFLVCILGILSVILSGKNVSISRCFEYYTQKAAFRLSQAKDEPYNIRFLNKEKDQCYEYSISWTLYIFIILYSNCNFWIN